MQDLSLIFSACLSSVCLFIGKQRAQRKEKEREVSKSLHREGRNNTSFNYFHTQKVVPRQHDVASQTRVNRAPHSLHMTLEGADDSQAVIFIFSVEWLDV